MKRMLRVLTLILTAALFARSASAAAIFDKKEYAARRARLMEKIPDGVAIFQGAAPPAGDIDFRQGHDFGYFTGVPIPDAFLIIDGVRKESLLFFTMTEKEAEGEGIDLDLIKNAKDSTGIERILPAEQFATTLTGLSHRVRVFYTMFKPEELGPENTNEKFNALQKNMTQSVWDGRLTRELQFVKQLRDKFPQVDVRDCSALVWALRMIKSPAEIDVMGRTAQIGVKAHRALVQSTRPGVAEKALASVFEFVCNLEGAIGLAFNTIIMSGRNHAYGHYHAYTRTLKDGDFLILDAGPDYADYHADISTTFPASGKFSPRQKELYEVALAVLNTCQSNYKPGVTFSQVGEKVTAMLKEKGWDKYANDFRGVVRYGGYNHMIGLATHDVTGGFAGSNEVLAPGFVFACDIQLFRVEEEIGIRLEDTVAITETGCEILSRGIPRTVQEVETLMKSDGILQILKSKGQY
jgi:Xaa-Pro aminopeptidase